MSEYRGAQNPNNPHRHGWSDVKRRTGLFMPTTMPKVNVTDKRTERKVRRRARWDRRFGR